MITLSNTQTAGAKASRKPKEQRLSKDGKWRYFKAPQNLIQYVPSGIYFARVKHNGKAIRASLETDVFETAKVRLPDKVREIRKAKVEVGTFGDGRLKYEAETRGGYTNKKGQLIKLAPLSVAYRMRTLECLQRAIVEQCQNRKWSALGEQERADAKAKLDGMKADQFTDEVCKAWATDYSTKYAPIVFNNTVNTFRRVLELAGLPRDNNAAYRIGRMIIPETELNLPRPEQFDRIIELVDSSGAAQAHDCSDLIRFLAFTGARISEAKQAVWADVDWQVNTLLIHSVKVRNKPDATRKIPLNPALKSHLERLRQQTNPQPSDRICAVSECQGALTRACKLVGCARLTHHDLRHYFVTKCLQAGVDVFTLAKWVGHRDNGKLLLKVYSHLQAEHSQSMALKVTFGQSITPENVLPLKEVAI